jgi:hypothetical protein
MSPYGHRFGGDNAMPSACALDLMASSVYSSPLWRLDIALDMG